MSAPRSPVRETMGAHFTSSLSTVFVLAGAVRTRMLRVPTRSTTAATDEWGLDSMLSSPSSHRGGGKTVAGREAPATRAITDSYAQQGADCP